MKFSFHLLKHQHLWHPWCLFWCRWLLWKKSVGFSNILQCNSYYVSQQSLIRENMKYKKKITLMVVKSIIYLLMPLVSINILAKAPNPQPLGAPLLPKKKIFMSNLLPLMFLTCLFDTSTKLFIVISPFFIKILIM